MLGPLTETACSWRVLCWRPAAWLGRGSTAAGRGFPLQSQSTWAEQQALQESDAFLQQPRLHCFFSRSPAFTTKSDSLETSRPVLVQTPGPGSPDVLYLQAHQAPLALGPARVTCAILPRPLWLSVLWHWRLPMLVEHTCSALDGVHRDRLLSCAELSALSLS